MPKEGVKLIPHREILSFEEIYDITVYAVKRGINKVRLTGGEPLIRRDIMTLVKMISTINGIQDYAMTTNGILLPRFAEPLKKAGLHRLNVSLDTLCPERYSEITCGGDVNMVIEGLKTATAAGFKEIKLNCVIQKSPEEKDAKEVAKFAKKQGYLIRYIRRMNIADGTFWSVEGGDGGNCKICNRLRLTSDGKIYPCLFNDKTFSIRKLGLKKAIDLALQNKPESGDKSKNNEFYSIGG